MAGMPGIVIKVAADTRDAIGGLKKVDSALGRSSSKWSKFSVGVAAAGAAAAAGVAALGVAVADGVKAFSEEEDSLATFHKTLDNLDMKGRTKELDGWIDNLQYSANVADDQLRPAMSRLLRSTGDVGEAQKALGIALDISAATGKDLDTVANGLGKAYDGNASSLGRLGLGLDKALLKSGDMVQITQQLTDKFGGQTEAAAGTLSGAIKGVGIAWDELQESFGKGIVLGDGGGGDTITRLEAVEKGLRDLQPGAERAGASIHDVGVTAIGTTDRLQAMGAMIENNDWSQLFDTLSSGDNDQEWTDKVNAYYSGLQAIADGASFAASQMDIYTRSLQRNAGATDAAASAAAAADAFTGQPLSERLRIMRLQHKYAGIRAENAKRKAAVKAKKADRAAAAAKARADALAATRASARLGRPVASGNSNKGTVCA